jgi:hypothetical protein
MDYARPALTAAFPAVATIMGMIALHPGLDPKPSSGKIGSMIRRLIHSAMRSSLQEVLEPSLVEIKTSVAELKTGIARLETRLDATNLRLDAANIRFDAKFDSLSSRFDNLTQRFEAKFDEFSIQQGHLVQQVAGLQRAQEATQDILHRIGRLEDRLLRA